MGCFGRRHRLKLIMKLFWIERVNRFDPDEDSHIFCWPDGRVKLFFEHDADEIMRYHAEDCELWDDYFFYLHDVSRVRPPEHMECLC